MNLNDQAAQGTTKGREPMTEATVLVLQFAMQWQKILWNPLSYVPEYLLPPELRPTAIHFGDKK